MKLEEIQNKNIWEEFLVDCSEKTFLQSWNWGEYNTQMGSTIWRFGIYENNQLLAVVLIVKVSAKRGTFLFIPHGPVIKEGLTPKDVAELLDILLLKLKEIAKEEGASFIRVSPLTPYTKEYHDAFTAVGFNLSPMPASAYEATWKLDITPSEEVLLANMRKTTRYIIKKTAENADIEIKASTNPEDISLYQTLNKAVAKRQQFIGFSDKAIEVEFKTFLADKQVLFLFGYYKEEVVAGAMVIFWSGNAFYHQAASLSNYNKLSVPYLLQWEAIKEAKRRGCAVYDFWGFTDPEKFPRHPWAGPTLFKMGFGGYKTEYIKTQDYIINSSYWINYIIEKIRKMRRGI